MGARQKRLERVLRSAFLLTLLFTLAACGTKAPEAEELTTQAASATFTIVSATTDQDFRVVENNGRYGYPTPDALNIRVDGVSGPVEFYLDGAYVRTENSAPFAMFGNNGNDYFPGDLSGTHTVRAETPGGTFSATFTVNTLTGDVYVSPNGDDGADGLTPETAYKTIKKAVDVAQARRGQNKATVIAVLQGTYRQAVEDYDTSTGPQITVKGPDAVISGSDVYTAWSNSNNSTVHTYNDWTFNWGDQDTKGHGDRMITRRECVFNDGQLLRQVRRGETLTTNTFKVDEPNDKLLINVPSRGVVEVCVRPTLWNLPKTRNLLVEGLTFQHAATEWYKAAVLARSGQTYDGITVRWNGQSGLELQSNDPAVLSSPMSNCVSNDGACDIIVKNSYFNDNGFSGVIGFKVKDSMLRFSEVSRNNWRGDWWGHYTWDTGNKVLGVRNLVVRYNKFLDNKSNGWWCDTDCVNVDFYGNIVEGNREHGVMVELSQGPLKIHDNTFRNNGVSDILCSTVDRCIVHDNNMREGGGSHIFQVTNSKRCIVAQTGTKCFADDQNPTYWQNPFNLTENYYPKSAGFDVQDNSYKQVFFESMSDGEIAFTRDNAVVWTRNDENEGAADKVKVRQNGSPDATYTEQEFRNRYNWSSFD